MIEFLIEYKDYILIALAVLFNLILFFISLFVKKKPIDNDLTSLLEVLPDWIKEAEQALTDGKEKYTFVFNRAVKFLMALKDKRFENIVFDYGVLIDNSIENILSTPKKKGESYAKDNEKKSR